MARGIGSWKAGSLMAAAALTGVLAFSTGAMAQTATAPAENAAPTPETAVLLTIFLNTTSRVL